MASVMLTISGTPETKERFRKLAMYNNKSQARYFEEFVTDAYYKLKYTENIDVDKLSESDLQHKD